MITDKDIARINWLYKKSKEDSLTETEKEEQKELRKRYVEYIKAQVIEQLETVKPLNRDCNHGSDCHCSSHKH